VETECYMTLRNSTILTHTVRLSSRGDKDA
jgi:hypothetical protein